MKNERYEDRDDTDSESSGIRMGRWSRRTKSRRGLATRSRTARRKRAVPGGIHQRSNNRTNW